MSSLESFIIDLRAVGDSPVTYGLCADDSFFKAMEASDVRRGSVNVTLVVAKKAAGYFDLTFRLEGSVIVPCDRCLEDLSQPIDAECRLMARLGERYSEDDDLVTVDAEDGTIDVAWFVYEFIALDIPIKHVHASGECDDAMMEALKGHSVGSELGGDGSMAIDPRWSGLEKLKNNN